MIRLKPILKKDDQEEIGKILSMDEADGERINRMNEKVEALMQESFDMGIAIGAVAHKFKEKPVVV